MAKKGLSENKGVPYLAFRLYSETSKKDAPPLDYKFARKGVLFRFQAILADFGSSRYEFSQLVSLF